MENNLINLTKDESGNVAVSGRELHKGLKIETQYTKWINRMIGYGFEENSDFITISQKRLTVQGNETTFLDHIMTLDMAKEIAMIQRSKIGQKIRGYFISVEKEYRQIVKQPKDSYMIDDPVKRAQRWIEEEQNRQQLQQQNEEQAKQIEINKPKVNFANALESSDSSILIGELAKLITQNGYSIGQNKLFKYMRNNGYLCKNGERYNLPTQRSIDLEIMDIKKRVINNPNGSSQVTRTTKITVKGQQYFINKFLSDKTI